MVLHSLLKDFLHSTSTAWRVYNTTFGDSQDAIFPDTMQEIFQEAVQNHYLSFGYASPMIFMNKEYWTEEMPVYLLMDHLVKKGKYKNLLMSLTDSIEEIVKTILEFQHKV